MHEVKVPVPAEASAGRAPGEVNGLWAEFRTPLTAGEHWLSVTLLRMYEGLPPDYKGPKPSQSDAGVTRATDSFFVMYLNVVGPYKQTRGPSEESRRKYAPSSSSGLAAPATRPKEATALPISRP